ncbi:hypothetical protein EDB19DRAFT_1906442 [Suillus lakei]|nr:hypothetical protein EDB19DRAFT_1906442 [Suillus lakei]
MRNTSNAVSPFYDQEPGAPPPFPPKLADQLKLFGNIHHPTTLIADEILAPKACSIVAARVARTRSHSVTPMSSDLPGSSNSSSDDDSSTSAMPLSEDSKIPKPPGEPGRPGCGGYTLYETLNWSLKTYAKFKKYMHKLIDDHLEMVKSSSAQSPALLKIVRIRAAKEFPELEKYINLWPVNDMIMSCLKYTSGRARQKLVGMAVGKII